MASSLWKCAIRWCSSRSSDLRWCSCTMHAEMGEDACSRLRLARKRHSLLSPWIPLRFFPRIRPGPGCGSIPSSVKSRNQILRRSHPSAASCNTYTYVSSIASSYGVFMYLRRLRVTIRTCATCARPCVRWIRARTRRRTSGDESGRTTRGATRIGRI